MNNSYFEAELHYLREALLGFGENETFQEHDPSVERLLEGAAYLGAEVRRIADQQQSQISTALLVQVAPELLQSIPSATILEFEPRQGQLLKTIKIVQGARVKSRCIEEVSNSDCQFRVNNDLNIYPIKINAVDYRQCSMGGSQLTLQLQFFDYCDATCLNGDPLIFFLNTDYRKACELYVYLTRKISAASYQVDDHTVCHCLPKTAIRFMPHNFTHRVNSNSPFDSIKSFFAFPEQYFFISLVGLDQLAMTRESKTIKIVLHSEETLSKNRNLTTDTLKINCVSASNFFEVASEPIILNSKQVEYSLVPRCCDKQMLSIHDIKEVCAINQETGRKRIYKKQFEVCHQVKESGKYQLSVRMDKFGEVKHYIRFASNDLFSGEVISCVLRASNGRLPYQYIKARADVLGVKGIPDSVTIKSCIQPSPYCEIPIQATSYGCLIEHLLCKLNSLCQIEYFKALMMQLNWSKDLRFQKYIEEIKNISTELKQKISKGVCYPLLVISIEAENDQCFTEAEIVVFGEIIVFLFEGFIQINMRFQLHIFFDDNGHIAFDEKQGSKKLI